MKILLLSIIGVCIQIYISFKVADAGLDLFVRKTEKGLTRFVLSLTVYSIHNAALFWIIGLCSKL